MAILSIKPWEPWSCAVAPDVFIRMELKRLRRHEARPLLKVMLKAFVEADKAKEGELTSAQRVAILSGAYEALPEDELKRWFSDCVRNVQDFVIGGQPVTTGAELLENADDETLIKILMKLHSLSRLSAVEGKASGSPSLSPATPEREPSASPALFTGRGDGAAPSTATVIPTEVVSSTPAERTSAAGPS